MSLRNLADGIAEAWGVVADLADGSVLALALLDFADWCEWYGDPQERTFG